MAAVQQDLRMGSFEFYREALQNANEAKLYIEGQTGLSIDESLVLRRLHLQDSDVDTESLVRILPDYGVENPKEAIDKLVKKGFLETIQPSIEAPKWRVRIAPKGRSVAKNAHNILSNPAPFQRR